MTNESRYDPITERCGPEVGRRFHENMKGKPITLISTLRSLHEAIESASSTLGTFAPGEGRTTGRTVKGALIRDGVIYAANLTEEEKQRVLDTHPGHRLAY